MKSLPLAFALAGSAFLLQGCETLATLSLASEFTNTRADVQALSETTASTMPTSGSATYTGDTALAGDFGATNYVMLGETTLNAAFSATGGTVTGTMSNFSGVTLTDAQVEQYNNGTLNAFEAARAANVVDGTVAVTDGVIAGTGFEATTTGDLKMAGSTYAITGEIEGTFRGDGATAVSGKDTPTFTMTRDGVAANISDMEFYAAQ